MFDACRVFSDAFQHIKAATRFDLQWRLFDSEISSVEGGLWSHKALCTAAFSAFVNVMHEARFFQFGA